MSKHYTFIVSMCIAFALLFLGLNSAQASLIQNGGAETNDLFPWVADESGATGGTADRIVTDTAYSQSGGTVWPVSGNYFFSFAGGRTNATAHEGNTISMSQTGTDGLGAPALLLSGYVHTQTRTTDETRSDVGEAILKIFDSGDGLLGSETSDPLVSTDWMFFDVEIDLTGLSGTPAYWLVELAGTAYDGTVTNVFWDDLDLQAVPIPSTLLLFGAGLFALMGIKRRFKG